MIFLLGKEDGVLLDGKNLTSKEMVGNWTTFPGGDFSYISIKKYQGAHNVM